MLLLDENLSFRLIKLLAAEFTSVQHVANLKLNSQSDSEIWKYAKINKLCILTKDSDFNDMSIANGLPPKVIVLAIGNCSTAEIAEHLKTRKETIHGFLVDDHAALLILTGRR